MITDWSTIDDYFANRLPADERTRFEATLRTDMALAEAVAFYVSAHHTLQAEAYTTRREELMARKPRLTRPTPWPYAVAAAGCLALLLGIGWVLWQPQTSPSQLADAYIQTNLTELTVTMSADADSLQRGLEAANAGNLPEADALLTQLLQRQPANAEVLRTAGIISLRRGQYNVALRRFEQLSCQTNLMANPGLFYQALTRLKRNAPGDVEAAKTLLQTVINQQADGSTDAQALLDNL